MKKWNNQLGGSYLNQLRKPVVSQKMWPRLAIFGGFTAALIGSFPVTKTYYSDHVYVKYAPRMMFMNDVTKEEEYLKRIGEDRYDYYPRELYSRNYHRWLRRKPMCTISGEEMKRNYVVHPSESENKS